MNAREVEVGSLWRRNPPGREVVEIRRVWEYGPDAEMCVRAHPITGGRPLVAPIPWLLDHYTPTGDPT